MVSGLFARHAAAQTGAPPAATRPASAATTKPAEKQSMTKPADAKPAQARPGPASPTTTKPAAAAPPAAATPATKPAATQPESPMSAGITPVGLAKEIPAAYHSKPKSPHWPSFDAATLAWFAAIAILALSIRPRQFSSIRTLDAVVLAGAGLLMLLRSDTTMNLGGKSAQWWAYLGLTGTVAYWLIRGFVLVSRSRAVPLAGNLPAGPTLVLFLAGLALCLHQIATAPLSESSRDGIVGGLYFADAGVLPYADDAKSARYSPLVSLIHAGAVRLAPPALPDSASGDMIRMTWSNRATWVDEAWADDGDVTAARLANGVLFLLLLTGVIVVGQRLYSAECGLEIAALLCVFPGTLECVTDPAVLAPAALVAIASALTLLPGVGGLLGTFAFVFAGLAWPWAWLCVPIVIAYSMRHGLQALGSLVGLAAGVLLLGIGVSGLVEPALPRPLGALRMAGEPAPYAARLDDNDRLVIARREAAAEASEDRALTSFFWRTLLKADSAALKASGSDELALPASMPSDVAGAPILFRELSVRNDALPRVQPTYRAAVAELPPMAKWLVHFRTAIEAVWTPAIAREEAHPTPWSLWSAGEEDAAARWVTIRRVAKVVAVLLGLAAALAVYLCPRPRTRQVAGALMATLAAVIMAASHGAASNLLLLAPVVLMAWAAYDRDAATQYHATHAEPPVEPEPRITTT